MEEYKELIIEGLKMKHNISSCALLKEKFITELEPFDLEGVEEEAQDNFEQELFFDSSDEEVIKCFVEERIGEDFLVLEGFEGYVLCIHKADDFLTESSQLKNMKENKQILTRESVDEYKIAA